MALVVTKYVELVLRMRDTKLDLGVACLDFELRRKRRFDDDDG